MVYFDRKIKLMYITEDKDGSYPLDKLANAGNCLISTLFTNFLLQWSTLLPF